MSDSEEKKETTMSEHIVMVSTDTQLDSAISFSQYMIQGKKLITLIGERHQHVWSCPKPSITIAEYCKNTVQRNEKTKIMLEYNSYISPLTLYSHNLKETYKKLVEISKAKHIIAFDSRPYFLGSYDIQSILYAGFGTFAKQSKEDIYTRYIEPFFVKSSAEDLFSLQGDYESHIVDYLLKDYYRRRILSNFLDIQKNYNKISKSLLHTQLKEAWMQLVDYHLLREILRVDDIEECIILMGGKHYANIDSVLSDERIGAVLLNKQTGSDKNCVKLYSTYRFETPVK